VFRGIYRGKQAHPDDLPGVIKRARAVGVEKMMVTGSDLKESKEAVDIAKEFRMCTNT
jgi:TatD DNase family protein